MFSDFEAIVILHTLLSAGGESTTSLLGNAVRILAEHQDLQQHLRENPEQIPAFVEEALRLESPFRYHMRPCPRTPRSAASTSRPVPRSCCSGAPPTATPPSSNDPTRSISNGSVPRHHVAFGRGIHHCVGAPLARIEARIVLTVLLERTSSITLDPEHAPRWVNSLMVRRHERLPVRLAAR